MVPKMRQIDARSLGFVWNQGTPNPLADYEFPFQIFKQVQESNMLSGIFNFQIPSREQGLTPVLRDNSLEQSK
jgi:hypothetical protein